MYSALADSYRFGGGAESTTLHPVVLVMMLAAIVLMLSLPRQYVFVPFLLVTLLAPNGQQLMVGGAHFYVGRLLVCVGLIRIALIMASSGKIELVSGGFGTIDKLVLLWGVLRAVAGVVLLKETAVIVNQIGVLLDTVASYFVLRFLVRDRDDIIRHIKVLAIFVIVVGATMIGEVLVGTNVFGYIGGRLSVRVREGVARAQGPFAGPISAGAFGATLLCLFFWLWKVERAVKMAIVGLAGSMLMILTSASSTALMTLPAALLGIAMWPIRRQMRLVRWGLALILTVVHFSMNAPVWMLINRVSIVGGNSSYHRAMLVDAFVRHFDEWWFVGVSFTGGWGWDMWDQANQFVKEGVTGGLATFICFILLISKSFGRLGKARKLALNRSEEWSCWLLGCALFAYVVSFFGISFSDQSPYAWYAFLAVISPATVPIMARLRSQKGAVSPVGLSPLAEPASVHSAGGGAWWRKDPGVLSR